MQSKQARIQRDIPYLLDGKTISVLIWMLSQQYPKMINKLEKNRSQMSKIITEQLRHSKYAKRSASKTTTM